MPVTGPKLLSSSHDLPGVCDGEASSVTATPVDHESAEEPRGAARGHFRRRGESRRLQFQAHVLLEGTDAGLRVWRAQLV